MGCCGQKSLNINEEVKKYNAEVKGTEVSIVENANKTKKNIENVKKKYIETTKNETKENVNNIKEIKENINITKIEKEDEENENKIEEEKIKKRKKKNI